MAFLYHAAARMKATPKILLFGVLSGALWVTLARLGDLQHHVAETILLLLLSATFYLVCAYFVLKLPPRPDTSGLAGYILLISLIFRLIVWPLSPALSDDVYRYRWEGKLQAFGGNPYQSRPADPGWAHLRDAASGRVPVPDFKAGYGPLLEQMQLWTYRWVASFTSDPFRQAFWFKLPSALFDLGTIAALWLLLAARGQPVERILIYAWCPLPIIEFWATGHNDSVPVFFVSAALLLAAYQRWTWSFVSLSLGAAAKIWPLLLFPFFMGRSGRRPERWYQWLVVFPIAAALFLPYWSDVEENIRFLSGFVGGWRNNDSIFGLLYWYTEDLYRAKRLAFVLFLGAAAALTLKRWPIERKALWGIAIMLMVSANCHPWYLTWLLPFLTLAPSAPLFLWVSLAPLAYHSLIAWTILGQWDGSTPFRWHIYVPVYGFLAGRWIAQKLLSRSA